MVMYAKCVSIRDKQRDEKKQLWNLHKEQEKKKDLIMEIDRLKKIKHHEEIETAHKEKEKKDHLVIVD